MEAIISWSSRDLSSCGPNNRRRQEDQQLLLGDILGLVFKQPSQDWDTRQIRNTCHVIRLGIDENTADDHRLSIANQNLRRGLATVNARTRGVTPCTHRIPGGSDFHEDLFPDFLWITRGNLRRHVQFQVCVHEGSLRAL
jgi:hypothetical protein